MDSDHQTPPVGDEELRAEDAETAAAPERRQADAALEFRQRRADLLRGHIEHRDYEVDGMECRALDDGTIRMSGVASVTEHWYDVGDPTRGGFREKVSRAACKRTLGESPDVSFLGNHEGWPMARTTNGSLSLRETARGLEWAADIDSEDPESKVVARKVERGLIDQCSFAFQVTDDQWNEDYTERTIKSLSLHRGDVSVVTHGANEATSVGVLRSADGNFELRAGKAISAARMQALQGVLDRIAAADEQLDAAQPELADILGVENPDADDAREAEAPPEQRATPVPLPDYTTGARQRLAALRRVA